MGHYALEGAKNAAAIAKVPGVTAIFAASGDLGNFSRCRQGTPDYERLIESVYAGPIAWRNRPDFTCFQQGRKWPPSAGERR
jgi:hypothetical protein